MRSSLGVVLLSLSLSLALATAAGCVTTEYRGSVAVTAPRPDLVAVAPGVQVIANYDEPIFVADGFYWWFFGGGWYRSTSYLAGWTYIAAPPSAVVRIHQPNHYRFYQPPGFVAHRRPVAVYHVQWPVRDHRSDESGVRDHVR